MREWGIGVLHVDWKVAVFTIRTVDLFSIYLILSRVDIVIRYIEVDFTLVRLANYVRYIEVFNTETLAGT